MAIDFNTDPYYDDFEADGAAKDSNYMRILFKPSRAVQARELTQIQSIIQNQIKLFGDHIFQDGSPVIGGHLTFDNSARSVKLENAYSGTEILLSDFNQKLVIDDTGSENKSAYVIAIDDTQENKTLMVRYLRGVEFADGQTIKLADDTTVKATLIAENSQNTGSVVSINEGVFYVNGFFVQVPQQTIVLEPYSKTPTYRIGLEIEENIIDESDDTSLLDPAQGSFNYQAPGADRYQFSLNLSKRTLDSLDDSSFFELLRVENGVVTKQVKYPVYSELEKTMARRTFDESGNYTVTPFRASAAAHPTDDTKFNIVIEPGKAYVRGFEFETAGVTQVPIDRATTTETVDQYDLSLEFGNYVAVKNLNSGTTGFPNFDDYPFFDMHAVPSGDIQTGSQVTYNSTLIGTARVRSLQKRDDSTYNLYILDQSPETKPLYVSEFVDGSLSQFQLDTEVYSNQEYSDLFVNSIVTVIGGDGDGQVRKIVSIDAGKKCTLDRPFDILPAIENLYINFAFSDVRSFVRRPAAFDSSQVFATQGGESIYACMDVDPYRSQTSTGATYLSRTNFNKLIYPLPDVGIDSIDNVSFYHRDIISATFTGGQYTLDAGDGSFYYGTSGSYLSDSQVNTNILVLVKSKGDSAFADGQILSLTYDPETSAGAFRNDSTITLFSGQAQTFTADIIYNYKLNLNDVANLEKSKTLKGVIGKTTLSATDSPTNADETVVDENSDATGILVDTANGIVWFTDTADIVKTPGTKQSLYVSDAVKLLKVFDSGDPTQAPNTSNAIDITNRYLFDSGQRDNYYDHSSIILKDGKAPPTGQTAVIINYYSHTSEGGFFSGSSYTTEHYNNDLVPYYSSGLVPKISLRDTIDFRPRRVDFQATTAFTGIKLPYTELSMELDYDYYLPRIDKLVATESRQFELIRGIPAKFPIVPSDYPNSMTLYEIFVPANSSDPADVQLKYVENKRYTMNDIGKLENRIKRIEYYTQLSLLEKEAKNETFLYEDGAIEKEKYGILVEQFDGFNISDNNNPDLLCNIAFNQLRPYRKVTALDMKFDSASGAYKKSDRTFSLTYTEEDMASQSTATKAITVQPYMFATYNGNVELKPEMDNWISSSITPEVVVDVVRPEPSPDPVVGEPVDPSPPVIPTTQEPVNTVGFELGIFATFERPPFLIFGL